MDDLTKLQDELKQIILTFEEKASGNKIDNKHLIKQFTSLVKNEDINEELINFIIDSTDEINTRHFQFVEHTTKTIKDISEITHKDIEKLKKILENTDLINKNTAIANTNDSWYDIKKWSILDIKTILTLLAIVSISTAVIVNVNNKEFFSAVKVVATSLSDQDGKKE